MKMRNLIAVALMGTLALVGCGNNEPLSDTSEFDGSTPFEVNEPGGSTEQPGDTSGDESGTSGTGSGRAEYVSEKIVGAITVDDEWVQRKLDDDTKVRDALSPVFTWDNSDSYFKGRDALVDGKLGIAKDADFARALFPEEYPDGTNMKFLGIDSYVTDGTPSSDVGYFALVHVQSEGMNNFKANGDMVMTYTVSPSGDIKVTDIVPLVDQ